jgi:hypothetical protein
VGKILLSTWTEAEWMPANHYPHWSSCLSEQPITKRPLCMAGRMAWDVPESTCTLAR